MDAIDSALKAVEQQAKAQLIAQVSTIADNFGAVIAASIKANPQATAAEILSREDVHTAIVSAIDSAQAQSEKIACAAYLAAAQLALGTAVFESGPSGLEVGGVLPSLDGFMAAVVVSIRQAFGSALLNIQDAVQVAHDRIAGSDSVPVRVLSVRTAISTVVRRLEARVAAAGVVSVHRGFSDAQLSFYARYSEINPHAVLRKRWEVRSDNPCSVCKALDGTVAIVPVEFDPTATTDPRVLPSVYYDLQGPPRHPNCRCRLVLEVG